MTNASIGSADRPPQGTQLVDEQPAPQVPAPPKPRFDFYDMLPRDSGPPLPDVEVQPRREPRPDPQQQRFLVQVGSFRDPGDADRLKAELTLMGHDVRVQRSDIPGTGVRFRVRLGPYVGRQAVEKTRRELSRQGFEVALINLDAR